MKKLISVMLCMQVLIVHAQNQPSVSYPNFYEYQKAFYQGLNTDKGLLKNMEEDEAHEGEFEQFKRMEWWNVPRVFPSGEWQNYVQRSLDAEVQMKNQYRSSNGRWQACGPNSIYAVISGVQGIGRVNRIVFGQSGALYAATAQGGLWKRVGSNWTCLTNFIPNLTVSGIAIDPLDENVIYIITGDADGSSGPALNSMGIFKTQDGGASWYKTGYDIPVTTSWAGFKIVDHPTSGNILMVASTAGILRSTDSGLSWDTVATDGGAAFFDIEMKPDNPSTWYACTKDHIFRSTNSGLTWSTPHVSNSINTDGQVSRAAIAVTAANPNIVYILSGLAGQATGRFTRLQRSTNAGTTFSFTTMSDFTNTGNILGWSYNATTMGSQAGYDLAIAASPTNADEIYIGGINVWYNNAGGAAGSWSLGSHWSPEAGTTVDRMHADQHDIVYQGGDLYVGNDGGVYYHDIGAGDPNWDVIYAGLNITQFYSVELDPTNPNGNSMLGAQDNGELKYSGGDNFQMLWTGDGGEACVDFTDNNRYYFYINDNLLKDGCDLCWPGDDSPQYGCGCPDDVAPTPSWMGDRALEINPLNHSQLYSGYTCLFRTDNEGSNWSYISSVPCTGGTIRDLDFDISNRLWVTKDNAIYRQNSAGSTSFTNVTSSLPVGSNIITGLACSSSNSQMAFVTFSGYTAYEKVYYTYDGGVTWTNISGLLPNVPVNCIVYQPNSNDGVYIGTDIGVFYSDNDITSWTPFRNGMPSVAVTDLEISTVDNMLYAATFGRGLWKSDLFNGCQSFVKIISGQLSSDGYVGAFSFTSGYNTYRAVDSIIVNMPLSGGLGQNVLMISEGYIKMKEGFEVKNNSEFRAMYNSYCFNGFYSYMKGEYMGEMDAPENETEVLTNQIELQLSVYPNPCTNELRMGVLVPDADLPLKVFFTDLSGRQISLPYTQATYDGNLVGFRFNTSALSAGAYFITVQSGDFVKTHKVIKLSEE